MRPHPRTRLRPPPLLLWIVLSGVAGAQEPSNAAEAFMEVRAASRKGAVAREHTACLRLMSLPEATDRQQEVCRSRLAFLDARRDTDGELDTYAALEGLRRTKGLSEEDRRAQVAGLLEAPGVAPLVQREIALWLGTRALEDGDALGALRLTVPWLSEPGFSELDPAEPTDQLLGELHVRALARDGRTDDARQVQSLLDRPRSATPQEGLSLELREGRRRGLDRLSWGILGVFGGLALVASVRRLRSPRTWPRPRGLLALGALSIPVLGLASLWDLSVLPALLGCVSVTAGVHLLALGLHLELPAGPARVGGRFLSGLASLAAIWLVLHAAELPGYLGL